MPTLLPFSLRWFWILLLLPLACGGKENPPPDAPAKADAVSEVPVKDAPPPVPTQLPVPKDAVGWGQVAPADFAAAAGIWTGQVNAPMPGKPVGIALLVTDAGHLEAAFFAPKNAPVGGTHTVCHPVGDACWYTRPGFSTASAAPATTASATPPAAPGTAAVPGTPDRTFAGPFKDKTLVTAGSVLTVSLAHPKAAAFVEARPLLKSLKVRELTLRTIQGRIEAEITPLGKKLPQELVDAAHYWLMLAVNERANFLQAPVVGGKFFDALPGATLGVKKNTIHFAMAGDCSMLAWSLLAIHQLYPYLRP
ncbi:hypothetical protein KKD52_03900 [Myxococcota bacterium]|nr:hypothetical protein [Myxococcota bacterium]MBU1411215.1 hypothetical protein [Myxococcota bacterium]MBU1509484.1 hypothetical protein [Myxococcota bacterium]